jgi:enoyl-[acyl-carrier protein] reductase/trans-2-enoyl-CoA reductase (NAD+)
MIIKPRVRGFMCVSAHPVGCEANVLQQINYVKAQGAIAGGPKKVLIIGASTGYGLAARITAAFGCGAATLGVFFERPGEDTRPATAGWYNSAGFHKFAEQAGLYAKSINGDAYSDEIKQKTIDTIKADLGQVDLVIYSLASPRRVHPKTGVVYNSTLKPIGKSLTKRGLDTDREVIKETTLPPATQEEIDNTVAVMGGEDWQMWIDALDAAGVLAPGAKTTAFTYLGERVTLDIYWNGTIGAAKKDLDRVVLELREKLAKTGGDARVSVLKAVVTQASSAIPIMPLYLSALFKVMKEKGTHEGCIEQLYTLYKDDLYGSSPVLDADGRLRTDYKELEPDVQAEVERLWDIVEDHNINTLLDFAGYKSEFLRLFGFGIEGVDYEADVSAVVDIQQMA